VEVEVEDKGEYTQWSVEQNLWISTTTKHLDSPDFKHHRFRKGYSITKESSPREDEETVCDSTETVCLHAKFDEVPSNFWRVSQMCPEFAQALETPSGQRRNRVHVAYLFGMVRG
jgi:hypothetical protein